MPEPTQPPVPPADQSNWNLAQPEHIPGPSLAPPALALGSTLLLWGLASSWVISAVGLVLFAFALAHWIREIRHERKRTTQ